MGERYCDTWVSRKERPGRFQPEEILDDIRRVFTKLGTEELKAEDYKAHGKAPLTQVRKHFGTWNKALKVLGRLTGRHGRRYTEEEKFENLARVWEHFGRTPKYQEMCRPPSTITGKAYVASWGTWRKAIIAFTEWANGDAPTPMLAGSTENESAVPVCQGKEISSQEVKEPHESRKVSDRLRMRVLLRDHFRCVYCGRNPASELGVKLHVDHRIAWARGGPTTFENLQTLCDRCNLGKSDMDLTDVVGGEETPPQEQ